MALSLAGAFTAYQTATAARGLYLAATAPTYGAAGRQLAGVFGTDVVIFALTRLVPRMLLAARRVDRGALDEMVTRARRDAAYDTGTLFNGITGEFEGEVAVFQASAVKEKAGGKDAVDHARFVEFGTRAGVRGRADPIVADEGFFAADTFSTATPRGRRQVRRRRSYRTHPGNPAQPFFFQNARDVLAERRIAMAGVVDEAGSSQDWELQ